MTLSITRELLERYLRASGWTRLGNKWLWGRMPISAEIDRPVDVVAYNAERVSGDPVQFRLGLCAAAEMLYSGASDQWVLAKAASSPTASDHHSANAVAIETRANDLLRAAGIDPAAWEAAR